MANVLANLGRAILSSRLMGNGTEPKYVGIGNGAGTASPADTGLFSEITPAGASTGSRTAGTSSQASSSVSFTGSISGTTLTVTGTPTGDALAAGQAVTGGSVSASTVILAQLSGTPGGAGTYSVNNSQTVASTTLTATGSNDIYKVTTSITASAAINITNVGLFDNTTISSGSIFTKGDFGASPAGLANGDQLALTFKTQFA